METTPDQKLKVGDEVVVKGYYHEGTRKIVALYDQTKMPGGVKLDKKIDDFFISWNEDELILYKRRMLEWEPHSSVSS